VYLKIQCQIAVAALLPPLPRRKGHGAYGIRRRLPAEAGLSFIGIGVNPPTPSWGQMIIDGLGVLRSVPHIVMAPATALMLTVPSFNFLGDGLRDALNLWMKN